MEVLLNLMFVKIISDASTFKVYSNDENSSNPLKWFWRYDPFLPMPVTIQELKILILCLPLWTNIRIPECGPAQSISLVMMKTPPRKLQWMTMPRSDKTLVTSKCFINNFLGQRYVLNYTEIKFSDPLDKNNRCLKNKNAQPRLAPTCGNCIWKKLINKIIRGKYLLYVAATASWSWILPC